jgi:integrase
MPSSIFSHRRGSCAFHAGFKSDTMGGDPKPKGLANRADAKAKDFAAIGFKRFCWMMPTLSAEQSARLLEAIKHTRIYWPVLLALTAGVRRGEVFALRWKNVDLEGGSLRVVESLEQTKSGIRFKAPKSGKARAITLPVFAVTELKQLKRQQAEELQMLGVRQTVDTLVCARADGQPLQPQSLTHQFTRLINRVKDMPRIRFHDLRHSHATQLLLAGVHPKVAQERLGHATITTTLDLYSHVTDTMQSDAANRLDALFQAAITRSAGAK